MTVYPVTPAELDAIKRFAKSGGDDFNSLDATMFRKYLVQVRLQTRIADKLVEDRFQAWLEKQPGAQSE